MAGKPRGARALLGAAIAMVGALATVHPTNAVLVALSEVVPRLAVTLPPVITACGALLGAMSEPPDMGRRRNDGAVSGVGAAGRFVVVGR